MRAKRNERATRNRRRFYIGLIFVAVIGFGLYLSSTNIFKLGHAYYLYKTDKVELPKVEVKPKLYRKLPEKGEQFGVLRIPKIEMSLPIYEGTDEPELAKGVGHYEKSVLPGEKDNSVLSGHRDVVFRRLGELEIGDEIIVESTAGSFTYIVRKTRIVDADDRTVIVPKPRATLTLTTCYPFYFIGDAPERYIVVANMIEKKSD
ncbi:MAG: class D sortase [Bacilli bacterium]